MIKLIRILTCLMILVSPTLAKADPNSIYIDQIGDNSTITLTQTGNKNAIGTELRPFTLQGNAQTVTVKQTGVNNKVDGKIENANGVNVNVNNTGDSNQITFDYGSAASIAESSLTLAIIGSLNTVSLTQGDTASSTNATQEITITGDQNEYTSIINTNDVTNTFDLTGDSNTISMLQEGYDGKNVSAVLTGSNNNLTINQTSTLNADSLTINSNSNSSNFVINQCNSGC